MSTSHYRINNTVISGSEPTLQGWRMIRSILFLLALTDYMPNRGYDAKGLLLMASISRLMDAMLRGYDDCIGCVLKPEHAYVAPLIELTMFIHTSHHLLLSGAKLR